MGIKTVEFPRRKLENLLRQSIPVEERKRLEELKTIPVPSSPSAKLVLKEIRRLEAEELYAVIRSAIHKAALKLAILVPS